MLKLRKVELVGFKSFFEKTHLTFSGTGLTCIIGPNGCGKSNIVDAISWVLGEQSHKSLRAERMADCIFNGTAKRPPLGLAEVMLTLVDAELAEAARVVLERVRAEAAAMLRQSRGRCLQDADGGISRPASDDLRRSSRRSRREQTKLHRAVRSTRASHFEKARATKARRAAESRARW